MSVQREHTLSAWALVAFVFSTLFGWMGPVSLGCFIVAVVVFFKMRANKSHKGRFYVYSTFVVFAAWTALHVYSILQPGYMDSSAPVEPSGPDTSTQTMFDAGAGSCAAVPGGTLTASNWLPYVVDCALPHNIEVVDVWDRAAGAKPGAASERKVHARCDRAAAAYVGGPARSLGKNADYVVGFEDDQTPRAACLVTFTTSVAGSYRNHQ